MRGLHPPQVVVGCRGGGFGFEAKFSGRDLGEILGLDGYIASRAQGQPSLTVSSEVSLGIARDRAE